MRAPHLSVSLRMLRRIPLLALLLLAGLTCRDREAVGPGLPGHAALAVAPTYQMTSAGGPVIELGKVRALLIRAANESRDTVAAEASFEGDSAVLRFDVAVAAPSELFTLEVEALDTLGIVIFRGGDTVRVAPGPNPVRGAPALTYVAPDTALAWLVLSPDEIVLEAGESLQLSADGLGADETPVPPVALGWTSRTPAIASVSAQGAVTARELDGSAWIVARTFTGVADSVLVTVRGGVASVVISPDSAVALVGAVVPMYAEAFDAAGTSLDGRTVTWTSLDPGIASITALGEQIIPPVQLSLGVTGSSADSSGTSFTGQVGAAGVVSASVIGLAPGIARIVASTGNRADTATVRVESTAGIIERTEVRPRADTLGSIGDTLQLLASSYSAGGVLEPGTYTWIVRDPLIAMVTPLGTVVARSNGETWVIVSESGGTSDSARVTVQQRVTSVAVAPFSARVRLGSTQQYDAFPVDGRGNPVASSGRVTWLAESEVYAEIDPKGIATATGIGDETILATIDGVTGRALLTIVSPVERLVIAPDTITLTALGASGAWTVIAYDSAGGVIDGPLVWESSNEAVLARSAADGGTGTFTAVANGMAMVRATMLGVTATVPVRVQQQVASIELTPTTVGVGIGGVVQLTPRPLDANGQPVPGVSGGGYAWSTEDPTVALADKGIVRGLAIGRTTATASLGEVKSAPVTIDITDQAPAVISLGRDTIAVGVGDSVDLPIFLSRPAAAPLDVHLVLGDTIIGLSPSTVRIDAGGTSAETRVHARSVGIVMLAASDQTGGYATGMTTIIVQPSARMEPESIGIVATDEIPVRVLLSEPAPAGGVELRFDGNEEGIVAVSPLPVIIPAGQLASDVVVRGTRAGSITLVPVAAGLRGSPVRIVVADAVLAFTRIRPDSGCTQCEVARADATATAGAATSPAPGLIVDGPLMPTDGSIVVGAGQYLEDGYYEDTYAGGLSLIVPLPLHRSLAVQVRASDPAVVKADEWVTIDSGRVTGRLGLGGLRVGEATLVAGAPGWTDATQRVVVSTPHLGICCEGDRFEGTEDRLSVFVTDSLGRAHPRISSLVVRVSSSNPDVIAVIDTAPVIDPDESANYDVRVVAKGPGTAWIKARAGGHLTDSIEVRVTGGTFQLRAPATVGESQRSNWTAYIALPTPAPVDRVFTLESSVKDIVSVPPTVTVRAGETIAYFDVDGLSPGTATIRASSDVLEDQSVGVTVTSRALRIQAHDDTLSVQGTRSYTVYTTDSTGMPHTSLERVVVRVRARDEAVIATEPDTVVIAAGQYFASGSMRGLAVGSTRLRAQASSHSEDSTGTIVVTGSALRVNDGGILRTIGVGQRRSGSPDYVSIPEPGAGDLQVRISGAKFVQVPSTVTIPAGATWTEIPVSGASMGVDTLVLDATGHAQDTIVYQVTAPYLIDARMLPASVPLGSGAYEVRVGAGDAAGVMHTTERELTIRVRSTNPDVLALDSAIIHVPTGASMSTTAHATFLGYGSAAVIFEDAEGLYAPDTTAMIVVTAAPLSFATSTTSIGMRQQTEEWEQSVLLPAPSQSDVTVFLASSDARVAGVPESVVIRAGTTSASFRITGGDAAGTVQISARADGFHEARSTVEVGRPSFKVSVSTWNYTIDTPPPISIWAVDHRGQIRAVGEDVRVTLTSSNPAAAVPDSAVVTIRAGTHAHGEAGDGTRLHLTGVGTTVISASDPRAGSHAYRSATSGTVQVRRPDLSLGYDEIDLGIGQYLDNGVWAAGTSDVERVVTITRTAPEVAAAPTQAIIAAHDSYAPLRLTGATPGTDTLVVTMPGYAPDTTILRVDLGTVELRTPGGLVFGSTPVGQMTAVRLHALGPRGEYVGAAAEATTWTLVAGPGIEVFSDAAGTMRLDRLTLAADQQLSDYFYVRGAAQGTWTLSLSNPSYRTLDRPVRVDP